MYNNIKEQRKIKAKKWTEKMSEEWDVEIAESIYYSAVYRDKCEVNYVGGKIPEIIVKNSTTQDAIINDCTILNFASFKNPGGGFINGSMAQEEALCHSSFLYNVLSDNKFAKQYDYNKKHLNKGLYTNFGIYTPDVPFINSDIEYYFANVITVAAPNLTIYSGTNGNTIEYTEALESRIKFILDIAEKHTTKTLVLGAFGCGVFKNSPVLVAKTFRKYLESGKYNFDKVIFAIPEGKDNNYKVFKNIF